MYEKVRAYIKDNQMLLPGDRVIAGVSGGGDSMAMLHMLFRLSKELEFSLETVHVHHGIRGEEADRDKEVVEKFCMEYGIPFRLYQFDVPRLAGEWKLGLEETGRIVRRQAFEKEQEREKGKGKRIRVALAHNQNDLAETMLHNLSRGSGLRGIAGIREVNGEIIRPVLCLERREIDYYLKEKKIPYVTDSSNLEDDYTRNRIRHHVLPLMEKEINTGTVAHMAGAARMIAEADDFLTGCAEKILKQFAQEDGTYLLTEEFFEREPILKSYAIMEAIGKLAGKRKDVSSIHVQQVLELYEKQSGRRISLPYDICARKIYGGILLFRQEKKTEDICTEEEWMLPLSGTLVCELGKFETEILEIEVCKLEIFPFARKISEKKYTKWMDYDKIEKNLSVRTRRAGDYLIINETGSRKKLRRCMIDDKIPGNLREEIPLVTCGPEVLWIVGGRISEKYKITPDTKRVLEVRYQGGNQDE